MDLLQRNKVYNAAIQKWGQTAQVEMLQEEATELALAARKFLRKNHADTFKNLASEIADVEIMIEQMKFMFPDLESQIDDQKTFKVNRLKDRVQTNTFTE